MDISNMSPGELAEVNRHYQEAKERQRLELQALRAIAAAAAKCIDVDVDRHGWEQRSIDANRELVAAVDAWRSGHPNSDVPESK